MKLLTDFESFIEVVELLLDEHTPNNKIFFINTLVYKILLEIIFANSERFI
ncbi:hypothetical protein AB996_0802 [Lactococcus cremoris]|uniref:Uncharacterized protein n=1 Tax=Lactococcus lactis subsp. cremoris TaxID=1359 RepID=A0A161U1B8_LACLC|nr:hypothetical protein AB996_0802 [Lactococcus cremoris]